MADFLTNLRDFLVVKGVGRYPSAPDGATPLPPIWLEPRNGAPAPGEGKSPVERGQNSVIGIFWTAGIPTRPYEGFLRTNSITFWIRTTTAPAAHALEAQLRNLLNDQRAWMMGTVLVNESMMFRDLTPVSFSDQGYTGNTEYTFLLWS